MSPNCLQCIQSNYGRSQIAHVRGIDMIKVFQAAEADIVFDLEVLPLAFSDSSATTLRHRAPNCIGSLVCTYKSSYRRDGDWRVRVDGTTSNLQIACFQTFA